MINCGGLLMFTVYAFFLLENHYNYSKAQKAAAATVRSYLYFYTKTWVVVL